MEREMRMHAHSVRKLGIPVRLHQSDYSVLLQIADISLPSTCCTETGQMVPTCLIGGRRQETQKDEYAFALKPHCVSSRAARAR